MGSDVDRSDRSHIAVTGPAATNYGGKGRLQSVCALLTARSDMMPLLPQLRTSEVQRCRTVGELRRVAAKLETTIIVCDTRDLLGARTAHMVRAVASTRERLGVVFRVSLRKHEDINDALDLLRAGIDVHLVVMELEHVVTPATAANVHHSGSAACVAITDALVNTPAERGHDLLKAFVVGSYPRVTVATFAQALGVSGRHLERLTAEESLPNPKTLLAYLCSLHILWRREFAGHSSQHVARNGGFGTARTLGRWLRVHCGANGGRRGMSVPFITVLEHVAKLCRSQEFPVGNRSDMSDLRSS